MVILARDEAEALKALRQRAAQEQAEAEAARLQARIQRTQAAASLAQERVGLDIPRGRAGIDGPFLVIREAAEASRAALRAEAAQAYFEAAGNAKRLEALREYYAEREMALERQQRRSILALRAERMNMELASVQAQVTAYGATPRLVREEFEIRRRLLDVQQKQEVMDAQRLGVDLAIVRRKHAAELVSIAQDEKDALKALREAQAAAAGGAA